MDAHHDAFFDLSEHDLPPKFDGRAELASCDDARVLACAGVCWRVLASGARVVQTTSGAVQRMMRS